VHFDERAKTAGESGDKPVLDSRDIIAISVSEL
jgi:hypothetical protein